MGREVDHTINSGDESMNEKLDLKKSLKACYQPSTNAPVIVEVPELHFLMIDGFGNPNDNPEFSAAIEALFSLAYSLKFAVKKAQGIDYAVMPLEGLWWMAEDTDLDLANKEKWAWTLMICQPDFITSDLVEAQKDEVRKKKNPAALTGVRFESYAEGPSVQIMHVGPFDAEGPNLEAMETYARSLGYGFHKKHHEIYLNDFNKTAPERLKTVLRHPICRL